MSWPGLVEECSQSAQHSLSVTAPRVGSPLHQNFAQSCMLSVEFRGPLFFFELLECLLECLGSRKRKARRNRNEIFPNEIFMF